MLLRSTCAGLSSAQLPGPKAKSLFRNILPATPCESIICGRQAGSKLGISYKTIDLVKRYIYFFQGYIPDALNRDMPIRIRLRLDVENVPRARLHQQKVVDENCVDPRTEKRAHRVL